MKLRVGIAAALLCMAIPCSAQDSLEDIMVRVLERDRHDIQVMGTLDYHTTVAEDKPGRTDNGNVLADLDISIQNILRRGRYRLSLGSSADCPGTSILFSPRVEKEQLPAPEDSNRNQEGFNKILNNLSGEVCVDSATYGIIKFSADLPKTITFKWALIPMVRIFELSIRHQQIFLFDAWLPNVVSVYIHQWNLRDMKDYRGHHTKAFENYQQRPPSN